MYFDHNDLGEIRAKGLFTKIGAITKPLIAWRDEIRTQECNVGNMIADILRQYTNSTFGMCLFFFLLLKLKESNLIFISFYSFWFNTP